MNQAADNNWIDSWLEAQSGWLDRWQSLAVEQRAEAMRSMDALREQFGAAGFSADTLQGVQNFQSLLQSFAPNGETQSQSTLWQQMLQAFPLGPAREQQSAWQEYAQAQADYQSCLQVVMQAFSKVLTQSLAAVSTKVDIRASQGKPVTGMRELYELWIECGEQAFAELAPDESFITAQAASGNALSRLKIAQNVLIERWLKSYDLPTRSELNSVHLRLRSLTTRIAQLEQQLSVRKSVATATRSKTRKPSKE
ncbi:MAG: poly(R)-hydroxyalkanoic acid synthase subunit PhaE [Steroidobacteraceae bacterium]